ncbi:MULTISPECIES: hypothetical protein [unclassified Corallococcus]|uniref:hypothetical protein n=1 Tax=unclassified Corallococcus TaxID=2685029 RepID=UPI001A8BF509|nr:MULTISPECIES: hypothetical protein [unclassified Corallococcus]MBN9687174.1 hypothetical protein [Corallococcus sp. NCSPR001]WAS88999.1 hypothetical protein O0N60_18950 [Corallococcus sp. NCRR]
MMPRFICLLMLSFAIPVASASAGESSQGAETAEGWFENPTRSRGLLGSTALPLHAGEGYIGQKAFFATVAEVGLSERVSVHLATASLFQLVYTDTAFSLMGGIKVSTQLTEKLHLAFGAQGGSYDSDLPGSLGLHNAAALYGTLTYGTADANLSLTVQPIYVWARDDNGGLMVMPMVGGFLRVSAHWGFAGEIAISPVPAMADAFAFATAGTRFMGPRWSVDLGVLAGTQLQGQDTPAFVPGASFLYHWP